MQDVTCEVITRRKSAQRMKLITLVLRNCKLAIIKKITQNILTYYGFNVLSQEHINLHSAHTSYRDLPLHTIIVKIVYTAVTLLLVANQEEGSLMPSTKIIDPSSKGHTTTNSCSSPTKSKPLLYISPSLP